jgi:hypothetical protein
MDPLDMPKQQAGRHTLPPQVHMQQPGAAHAIKHPLLHRNSSQSWACLDELLGCGGLRQARGLRRRARGAQLGHLRRQARAEGRIRGRGLVLARLPRRLARRLAAPGARGPDPG